jgi:hypothetical protein
MAVDLFVVDDGQVYVVAHGGLDELGHVRGVGVSDVEGPGLVALAGLDVLDVLLAGHEGDDALALAVPQVVEPAHGVQSLAQADMLQEDFTVGQGHGVGGDELYPQMSVSSSAMSRRSHRAA